MKSRSILFILLLAAFKLSSQAIDFAPVGANWYFDFVFDNWPATSYNKPHLVEVVGEEIVQGKLCRKMTGVSVSLPDPCFVFSQNDTVFYFSNESNAFEMLYDFTAKTGDSWFIGGLKTNNPDYPGVKIVVDSTGRKLVGPDSLRVWHIHMEPENFFDWGTEIVETIGSTCYLGPRWGLFEGGPCGIRCYSDSDTDYKFVNYGCDETVLVSATQTPFYPLEMEAWPNPAADELTISIPEQIGTAHFQLKITNLLGQQLLSKTMAEKETTVDVSSLPPGPVFIQVIENGQVRAVGRAAILR